MGRAGGTSASLLLASFTNFFSHLRRLNLDSSGLGVIHPSGSYLFFLSFLIPSRTS